MTTNAAMPAKKVKDTPEVAAEPAYISCTAQAWGQGQTCKVNGKHVHTFAYLCIYAQVKAEVKAEPAESMVKRKTTTVVMDRRPSVIGKARGQINTCMHAHMQRACTFIACTHACT